jgi:hypothetical protein
VVKINILMFLIYMSHKIGWVYGKINNVYDSDPYTFYLVIDTHSGTNTTAVSGEMSISWDASGTVESEMVIAHFFFTIYGINWSSGYANITWDYPAYYNFTGIAAYPQSTSGKIALYVYSTNSQINTNYNSKIFYSYTSN